MNIYLVDNIDYSLDGTIGGYVKLNREDIREIYENN